MAVHGILKLLQELYILIESNGYLTQSVERHLDKVDVTGSNPVVPTRKDTYGYCNSQ